MLFFAVWTSEKFYKILLWNRLSDFKIISQECALGNPFQKLVMKFWSVEKHGRHGGGDFLHYTDMKKFLKIFFSETADKILK